MSRLHTVDVLFESNLDLSPGPRAAGQMLYSSRKKREIEALRMAVAFYVTRIPPRRSTFSGPYPACRQNRLDIGSLVFFSRVP